MFKSDALPEKVDYIALISFAATPTRLTNGSRETLNLAVRLACIYPDTLIIGGTYFDNVHPDVERVEKERILGERFVWVGPVSSTTDEYEAIDRERKKRGLRICAVIVVDEEYHSIRARIVWKHYLPQTELCFRLAPGATAEDPENPMPLQRSAWKWLLANLVLAPFYAWFPGVEWWAKKNFNQSFKK